MEGLRGETGYREGPRWRHWWFFVGGACRIDGDDAFGGRGGEVGVSEGRSEQGLGDEGRQKPGPTDSKPRPDIAALAKGPG